MWNNKIVSVVLATYKEKNSVGHIVEEFFATRLVDEVVVVNNNAEPGTEDEVRKTKARMVFETRQGYGYAFRRGIQEAKGEYIVLCEPDGTYVPGDIEKFLVYAKNFPAVFGSRTNRSTIAKTRDTMNPWRRMGNVAAAKVIEILFGVGTLTDIGCTYKLFHAKALRKIEPYFESTTPLFATELMLLVIIHGISFVEIPATFRARVGISTISHNHKWIIGGMKVIFYVCSFWLRRQTKKITKKT